MMLRILNARVILSISLSNKTGIRRKFYFMKFTRTQYIKRIKNLNKYIIINVFAIFLLLLVP